MKKLLLLLLLAGCALKENVELADYECPDCNVILISIDTFRGDHLTCTGYNKYEVDITKNICDFSKRGVLFTHAIAQASMTQPSHASILTGAILSHNQAFRFRNQSISKDYPTLAEVLKKNGYNTGAFTGAGQMAKANGFDRGFDFYQGYKNDTFAEQAERGLSWLKNTTGKKFLFLHTYEIHRPYTPQISYVKELKENYTGTLGINITIEFVDAVNNETINITPEDIEHIMAMYDAQILSVDHSLGNFIEQLNELNILNNTILIITSDHGEEFGEHGKVGVHGHTIYNELTHVPLIVYAPGLRPEVSDKLVQSIDIMPTILGMLNIKIPPTVDGHSLALGDTHAISELDQKEETPYAVQSVEWKYYWNNSKSMVFDLQNDSNELKPLKKIDIQAEYEQIYRSVMNKSTGNITTGAAMPEVREQLRALGYAT
jgi:arylsulfatase A-like enzyme